MSERALSIRNLSLALLLGCPALAACRAEAQHEEQHGTFPVTHPHRQDTELVREYVAQIRASQHIELRALERGYLEDIFVDEGQLIEEDQLMFQTMPTIYQAEVSRAKAELDLAGIEYDNAKRLADKGVISASELGLAKAKYAKAKAELDLASAHRRLTEVHAPFAGIMGRFEVRKGSLLDEGELLTTLSDNRHVWVYFNVSEAEYLAYMARKRDEAETVRLRMANGEVFDRSGVIETIEADFDNQTGNIAFRAGFDNPAGLLRHGGTGKIMMSVPYPDALLIPQKATFEILDRRFVFVVDEHGTVHQREIEVAAELPNVFIVASGLDEHDQILLDGLRKVRDGEHVEVALEPPTEVLAHLDLHAE